MFEFAFAFLALDKLETLLGWLEPGNRLSIQSLYQIYSEQHKIVILIPSKICLIPFISFLNQPTHTKYLSISINQKLLESHQSLIMHSLYNLMTLLDNEEKLFILPKDIVLAHVLTEITKGNDVRIERLALDDEGGFGLLTRVEIDVGLGSVNEMRRNGRINCIDPIERHVNHPIIHHPLTFHIIHPYHHYNHPNPLFPSSPSYPHNTRSFINKILNDNLIEHFLFYPTFQA